MPLLVLVYYHTHTPSPPQTRSCRSGTLTIHVPGHQIAHLLGETEALQPLTTELLMVHHPAILHPSA